MERVSFFLLTLVFVSLLGAQEHQRVAARTGQQWQLSLDGTLTPVGYGWWASASPRIEYEFDKTWSLSWAQPYSWVSDPNSRELRGTRGGTALDLGWTGGDPDLRWRLAVGSDLPNAEGAAEGRWRGEAGLTTVRDPVILGGSLGLSVPGPAWQGEASFFYQEVANDHLTWSLVFSPQWTWMDGLLFWAVSAAWRVGWYEGPYSLSSGVSSGSSLTWSWSASAARSWDLR